MPAVTVGLLRVHFSYSLLIFVHDWFDFFFLVHNNFENITDYHLQKSTPSVPF
jgi:hypothetical protein